MYLSFIIAMFVTIATFKIFPSIQNIFICAFFNAISSVYKNIHVIYSEIANLQFNIRQMIYNRHSAIVNLISGFRRVCVGWIDTIRLLIRSYKNGTITFTTMREFAWWKMRMFVTELFENGLVIDHRDRIEVIYFIRDRRYRVIIAKKAGPRPILHTDGLSDSPAQVFAEALGPYIPFHGIPTTPKMLGYTEPMVITYRRNKTVIKYEIDEIITPDLSH